MISELITSLMPVLKAVSLTLASTLFGFGCDYIRKRTKIELTQKQEQQLWELAKRQVFQIEEKSQRLKNTGHNLSSKVKANEAISGVIRHAGIGIDQAESFVDAVLAETGLAASGKNRTVK